MINFETLNCPMSQGVSTPCDTPSTMGYDSWILVPYIL